jgi:Domain of Unknown Function (DUF1259)
MKIKLMFLTLFAATTFPAFAFAAEIDWKKVDAALGKSAAVTGDVHRDGLPRSDLKVTLDGVAIKPALALGGWVAFAPMQGQAMVMGDLVLLETEITPVMTKLLDGGLDITAIHNHMGASPATFYMHVGGHGIPRKWQASFALHFRQQARRRLIRPQPHLDPRPPSIWIRQSSMRSCASRAPQTVAFINSVYRAAIPLWKAE